MTSVNQQLIADEKYLCHGVKSLHVSVMKLNHQKAIFVKLFFVVFSSVISTYKTSENVKNAYSNSLRSLLATQ